MNYQRAEFLVNTAKKMAFDTETSVEVCLKALLFTSTEEDAEGSDHKTIGEAFSGIYLALKDIENAINAK